MFQICDDKRCTSFVQVCFAAKRARARCSQPQVCNGRVGGSGVWAVLTLEPFPQRHGRGHHLSISLKLPVPLCLLSSRPLFRVPVFCLDGCSLLTRDCWPTLSTQPIPLFDVNTSKRNQAYLSRIAKRRPFTVHVPGGPYECRYLLHAFSGYEVASCRAAPAFSMGTSTRLDWVCSHVV